MPAVGPAARELPSHSPFWEPELTLGIIVDGVFFAGHAKGDKARLLMLAPRAEHVIATWHGTRRSDLFTVPKERWLAETKSADARRNGYRAEGDEDQT